METLKGVYKPKLKRKVNLNTVIVFVAITVLLTSFASYIVFSNPVAPEIYLSDLPAATTYTIKTDGTNYWAVRYDGNITYEGTGFYTVFNNVLTAMGSPPQGSIHITKGSYTTNNEFIFNGVGGSSPPTHEIVIYGDGQDTVITQTAQNKRIFVFKNNMDFKVANLRLQMREANDALSNYAIHLSSEGSTKTSSIGGEFDNIWVVGGDNTHPLVYLENFMHLNIPWMWVYATYGYAMKIYQNSGTTSYGNSHFGNLRLRSALGGSLEITDDASSGSEKMNLLSFDHLELGYGGTIGLYIHGRVFSVHFDFVNVEGLDNYGTSYKIYADGSDIPHDITFDHITGDCPKYGKFLDLNGASKITINDGVAWYADSGYKQGSYFILDQNNIDSYYGSNTIHLLLPEGVMQNASKFVISGDWKPQLYLSGVSADYSLTYQTPYYTSDKTFPSGQTSYSFTHRVGLTPTYVNIMWKSDLEGKTWHISAINSTHVTVTLSAASSDSYTFDAFVGFYP